MTAPFKSIEGSGDIAAAMADIGKRARAAARILALASADQKNRALALMAAALRAQVASILAANAEDLVAEGHTIPIARVQAMHEGRRRKKAAREAAGGA